VADEETEKRLRRDIVVEDEVEEVYWRDVSQGDEALRRDYQLVHALFSGRVKKLGRRVVHEFLRGEEERAAFKVLTNLLREGRLPYIFHLALADFFDPDVRKGIPLSRRLVFVRRQHRGRKGSELDFRIAWDLFCACAEGRPQKQAIADAKVWGVGEHRRQGLERM
jgi:hypothetical protein